MQIRVTTVRGEERVYNLSVASEASQLKGFITRKKHAGDIEALKAIQHQFEAGRRTQKEDALYKTVLTSIQAVQSRTVIRIKVAGNEYDVCKPPEKIKLEKAIQRYGHKKDRDILESIKSQLEEGQRAHRNLTFSAMPLCLVNERLAIIAQEASHPYQPYTKVIERIFLSPNYEVTSFFMDPAESVRKYRDGQKIARYLATSVTQKNKVGQRNFEALSTCFWIDFPRHRELGYTSQLLFYITIVLQTYLHNASRYPAQGYGKAQKVECENNLFYARSQTQHCYVEQFRAFLDARMKSHYGVQNDLFKALVISVLDANDGMRSKLEKLTKEGVFREKTVANYFGMFLAHMGSRANNVAMALRGVKNFSTTLNLRSPGLREFLPNNAVLVITLNRHSLEGLLASLSESFGVLKRKTQSWEFYPNLFSELFKHRSNVSEAIVVKSERLKKIKVHHPYGATFIVIGLYPDFGEERRDNDNFKEGLTNVLIGFLGGLVNFNAHRKGYHFLLQRMQSFGFYRASLTDVGSLKIRLSLGLEMSSFTEVILESLAQLDQILEKYNFVDPGTSSTHALVNSVLKPCERPKGKQVTEKTGNYLLQSMRSEDDQWAALIVAQHYLMDINARDQNLSRAINQAFSTYLEQFILRRVQHEKIATQKDNACIKRDGYSVKNQAEVLLTDNENRPTRQQTIQSEERRQTLIQHNVIFKILQNTLLYTLRYLEKAEALEEWSYLHVLTKLLHNCQKGVAILETLHSYELSHLYAKANLIIENIIEYFIPFKFMATFQGIDAHDEAEFTALGDQMTRALTTLEKERVRTLFGVDADTVSVFYHDSGEQAITAGIITMAQHFSSSNIRFNPHVYLFPESYFELESFFKEMNGSIKRVSDPKKATIWFIDIIKIHLLTQCLDAGLTTSAPRLKAIMIDVTNNNSLQMFAAIKPMIMKLRQRGIWLMLACSSLKHEQLGIDKYQSGKNIVIAPQGKHLNEACLNKLSAISASVMNPLFASFRLTAEGILNENLGSAASVYAPLAKK